MEMTLLSQYNFRCSNSVFAVLIHFRCFVQFATEDHAMLQVFLYPAKKSLTEVETWADAQLANQQREISGIVFLPTL